jgi:hypothetical protein
MVYFFHLPQPRNEQAPAVASGYAGQKPAAQECAGAGSGARQPRRPH